MKRIVLMTNSVCWIITCLALIGAPITKAADDNPNLVNLTFTYGSEKEEWVKQCTERFNALHRKVGNKTIVVTALAMGSGECVQEVVDGKRETDLISPASRIFIDLANARQTGDTPLVASPQSLVVSPVVIAMWKPMAEALGYGQRPIGWSEMTDMIKRPEGWAAYDFPKWGKFKFGHTHPEYSNSGLLSLIAMTYAGAGKTSGLTLGDVDRPATGAFLGEIERSVVHYGSSTGFFGKKMFSAGPEYLSAAVLYENMVIESYDPKYKLEQPIVAIYPKEGTFWSDHPAGMVNRPWVTDEKRSAGKVYINYLLDRPQQEAAMRFGFRPSDTTVALGAPFDTAHGVDPHEPHQLLPLPNRDVVERILDLWKRQKKLANVILAIDISGSMNEQKRLERARPAAVQVVEMLGDDDHVSLLTFGTDLKWLAQDVSVKESRQKIIDQINGLKAFGRTSLYDAVGESYSFAQKLGKPGQMSIVMVLTDGEDTTSKLNLDGLKGQIKFDPDRAATLVFTIGYGQDTDDKVLQSISGSTQAKFYKGSPETIQKVLEDNASFFGAGAKR